ncbi:biopolymer transporter ExbD [Chitinispirillales bacterium ANBcel5]|uniref:ExbD/TolR family protein n=1 Tax=Cellulosispirillum alkaliphilum TaxID=3039283 RepID=UPI002A590D10|nr:biopolymer transporter ExbD [Chitinispirillales bacterium ANBcel5]
MSALKNVSAYAENNSGVFKPQLTSLVDVMVILLVFLIKSFSVEGSLVTPAQNVNLPLSSTDESVTQMESIEVTTDAILTDGVEIVSHSTYLNNDTLFIEPLYNWIKSEYAEVDEEETKSIMLQSDKDIEFNVIKRIMYTCSRAGITDFTVLVLNEE